MRVAIILGCIVLAAAGPVPSEKCTGGFVFNGRHYDQEVLKAIESADDLSYVKSTNTLFFSYTLPENASDVFGTAYLNLDTKEFYDIPGLKSGSATIADPESDEVYLAGDDGVYKYNPETKTAEYVTAKGVNIWALYFHENIFYITFPEFQIYDSDNDAAFNENPSITVREIAGNETEYFMTNSTGLYRILDSKVEEGEHFTDPEPDTTYNGFSVDANGNIYVFTSGAVYLPNRENKTLDKVADIPDLSGLTFDRNNNIIYSNENEIIKLTPRNEVCAAAA